jgi:DMSO/TMAO reductase YedYZ molybdopterin-dependent catalytic subunit
MKRPLVGTSRRKLLTGGAAAASTLMLSGCDELSNAPWFRDILQSAEGLTQSVQRILIPRWTLAREFSPADLSPQFRANGTTSLDDPAYEALAANKFADWRLKVSGLVDRELSLSLDDLRALQARAQITRHDCVEGWSCIGKWKGPPLGQILQLSGLKPNARYVVFHCADSLQSGIFLSEYYESIDLIDAFHPQTILAYEMNDQPLPVAHGAPVRLRVERQLGYKMAKYIMRIEVVESFAAMGDGKGGFWEDQGYEWYAGI